MADRVAAGADGVGEIGGAWRMRPRIQNIAGIILVLVGAAVALNGPIAGPHAFGSGWSAVAVQIIAGIALAAAGIVVIRTTR